MQFNELKLNKHLLRAISENNYLNPTPIQEKAIPFILDKRDVIATAQTGTGKTAAFALPILQAMYHKQESSKKGKKIKALVVSPTRELAAQIDENFKTYAKYTNLKSTVIFGGTSIEPQKEILKKGIDILIATPGRLLDLHKQDLINLDYVETLVLDEADLLLEMGFIDDIRKIERLCPKDKQTLLFSATMPEKVVELAKTTLKDPEKVEVSQQSSTAKNVEQHLFYVPKPKKIELCLHLLRNTIKKGTILIFRRTKYGVDKLEQTLLQNNYLVNSIHGAKTQSERQEALYQLKNKEITILIATDVASRGLDISNLDAVINFDVSNVPEIYVHRIGRTGRAGKSGVSYTFCSADEKKYIVDIQKLIQQNISIEENHPYPLDPAAKPEVHKSKNAGKYKKGRKSEASKKKKKRWY
jgi:ATP-dependent RNA helicase RhlE